MRLTASDCLIHRHEQINMLMSCSDSLGLNEQKKKNQTSSSLQLHTAFCDYARWCRISRTQTWCILQLLIRSPGEDLLSKHDFLVAGCEATCVTWGMFGFAMIRSRGKRVQERTRQDFRDVPREIVTRFRGFVWLKRGKHKFLRAFPPKSCQTQTGKITFLFGECSDARKKVRSTD